ncbi:hypothetical protein CFP66_35270 [Pseudonocardia sp. MH-G8]|nr:hypothetical protein CFP66_35270 [Pseudonocardia sp. MH-G8]
MAMLVHERPPRYRPIVTQLVTQRALPRFALTVFANTRMREAGEVERARRAMARCMAGGSCGRWTPT